MTKFINYLAFVICGLVAFSCSGPSDEEVLEDVIFSANHLLSSGQCQKAINLLEGVGRRLENGKYAQALASAYACKSGYSEPNFFTNDISGMGTTVGTIIGTFVQFSNAVRIGQDDEGYHAMMEGIDILLHAGNISSVSATARASVLSSQEADEVNSQLLFMLMVAMGKYAFYYGNANPTAGTKGTGAPANGNDNANTNTCFAEYHQNGLNGLTQGVCTINIGSEGEGHPQLNKTGLTDTQYATRLCEGVVLMNNFFDVLANLTLPGGVNLANLTTFQGGAATDFSDICAAVLAQAAGIDSTALCSLYSVSECLSQFGTYTGGTATSVVGTNALEVFLYIAWESNF